MRSSAPGQVSDDEHIHLDARRSQWSDRRFGNPLVEPVRVVVQSDEPVLRDSAPDLIAGSLAPPGSMNSKT